MKSYKCQTEKNNHFPQHSSYSLLLRSSFSFIAARAHCWLMFNLNIWTPGSFSARGNLISILLDHNLLPHTKIIQKWQIEYQRQQQRKFKVSSCSERYIFTVGNEKDKKISSLYGITFPLFHSKKNLRVYNYKINTFITSLQIKF